MNEEKEQEGGEGIQYNPTPNLFPYLLLFKTLPF